MEKNPLELVKNDEDAPKIQSVDVDDDPEEIMGCETVGRARIGRRKNDLEEIGRICHHLGRIWIVRVWSLGFLAEYQYLQVTEKEMRKEKGDLWESSRFLYSIDRCDGNFEPSLHPRKRGRMIHYSPASIILPLLGNLKQCPERV